MQRAIVLTVGTGDEANLEATLFAPLAMSIGAGDWQRAVLLPSRLTEDRADTLRRRLEGVPVAIRALPRTGDEDDADACFTHFDRAIEALREDGFAPENIVVDFTRGTKAMSAALVLAAVRHGVRQLRYIASGRRDGRGVVVAGTAELRETTTIRATAARMIDLARDLVARGASGAARDLLPDPDHPLARIGWSADALERIRPLRDLMIFLAAWDRLDHAAADRVRLPALAALPTDWRPFLPTGMVREWVSELGRPLPLGDRAAMAERTRRIAVDLLANAERRVAQGQFEDALVRTYRITELVAQARVFQHGLDPEALVMTDPALSRLRRRLEAARLVSAKAPGATVIGGGRSNLVRLLRVLNDPIADLVDAIDRAHADLRPRARNASVLVHGYLAHGGTGLEEWRRLFASLETLLRRDAGSAGLAIDPMLEAARFLPGDRGHPS